MYKDFKKEKPEKKGQYLWCENNWRSTDIYDRPIHRFSVRIAYWSGKGFSDLDRGLIDPDQWAEIPLPKTAEQ